VLRHHDGRPRHRRASSFHLPSVISPECADSEVLNLKWPDVDFLNGVLRLNAGETKNDDAREIPVPEEQLVFLKAQYSKRRGDFPFVCFRVDHAGRVVPIVDFRKVWKARCAKVGIGALRFHDLRGTFITDAEFAGAKRHQVMQITGRKTENVYRRYAIERRERRRAAMEEIVSFRAKPNGVNSGQVESENEETKPAIS
jgi:integrase